MGFFLYKKLLPSPWYQQLCVVEPGVSVRARSRGVSDGGVLAVSVVHLMRCEMTDACCFTGTRMELL